MGRLGDRIEWPKLIRAQAACKPVISFCSIRSMMNAVAAVLPLAAVHSNNKSLEMERGEEEEESFNITYSTHSAGIRRGNFLIKNLVMFSCHK